MQIPNDADIRKLIEENLRLAREQISLISDPNMRAEIERELAKAEAELASLDMSEFSNLGSEMDEAMSQLGNTDISGIEGAPSNEEIRRVMDVAMNSAGSMNFDLDSMSKQMDEAIKQLESINLDGIEGAPSNEEIRRMMDNAMNSLGHIDDMNFDLSDIDIQKQMDDVMRQLDNLNLDGIEGIPSKEEIRRMIDEAMKNLK